MKRLSGSGNLGFGDVAPLRSFAFLIASILMLHVPPARGAGSCPPQWSDQFPGAGFAGASALTAIGFDVDGDGPIPASLFVGGNFDTAGGISVNHIARFDGERWSSLGDGVDGDVRAMIVFDDDGDGPLPPALIAGGDFGVAGDVAASLVARWDGASWSPVGEGLQMMVSALVVFDADGKGPEPATLVAGGAFSASTPGPTFALAQWNGRKWTLIGQTDGMVNALCAFDPDGDGPQPQRLIVAGDFHTIEGILFKNIAAWDGREFLSLGGGVGVGGSTNDSVNALTVYDQDGPGPLNGRLIAGGSFAVAGGSGASAIASWDGAAWAPLGPGLQGGLDPALVRSLAVHDDDGPGPHLPRLIVAGDFNGAGLEPAKGLARWNGIVWAAFSDSIIGDFTLATVFAPSGASAQPQLFVGGAIFTPGTLGDDNFYRWNGQALTPLGNGLSNQVDAIAVASEAKSDSASEVAFVGGKFAWAGDVPVGRIARWDGQAWSQLGVGVTGEVLSLLAVDHDSDVRTPEVLYAGGFFLTAGGMEVNRIARWDGDEWSGLEAGMTLGGVIGAASVRALAARDADGQGPAIPQLYAGGEFSFAGTTLAKNIARWNGSQWFALGTGINNRVLALAFFDEDGNEETLPALFAGGEFSMAGGAPAAFIARWSNGSWSGVDGGLNGPVRALTVFDEDDDGPQPAALIVGGQFKQAGPIAALHIARWDGRDWSALGEGLSDEVAALAVADLDGAGAQPALLIAGGKFTHSGLVLLNHAGLWDGRAWSPLSAGVNDAVLAVAAFRDSSVDPSRQAALLGGTFQLASGDSSNRMARWGCDPLAASSCPGDVTGDGVVNGLDLAHLLAQWGECVARRECDADLDRSGVVDGLDLALLLAAWGPC